MRLPKLTLVSPKIQSGDLFAALELVMSSKTFEEAIATTESQEKRASNSPNIRYRSFSHLAFVERRLSAMPTRGISTNAR
ncbi:MAG: hypothetical protein AB4038_16280 [Prochloraceae cyanobacterium]